MTTQSDKPETRVQPNAFGCITIPFLLIAIVPLAWGARAQWSKGELRRIGEVVSGRVTEVRYQPGNASGVQRGSGSGDARGEAPVVAFTTRAGEARTAVGSVNRRPPPWAVGDAVDVVYDRPIRHGPTFKAKSTAGGGASRSGVAWRRCRWRSRPCRSSC